MSLSTSARVLLLDLDGTLTEAREPLTESSLLAVTQVLTGARNKGFEVGVVTGSPLTFMREQIGSLWGLGVVDKWLPCNGTLAYEDGAEEPCHRVDMRARLGTSYRPLIREILCLQLELLSLCPDLPFTGSFLTYRGSTLNWAPSGRDGSSEDREVFRKIDDETGLRETILARLKEGIRAHPYIQTEIVVTKGGQTSFDIYPVGWDKTYCLRHFPEDSEFFFIGDSTEPGGNDHSIATHENVKPWTTDGPLTTLRLIEEIANWPSL